MVLFFSMVNPSTQQAPKPHFPESIDSPQMIFQPFREIDSVLVGKLEALNDIMGDILQTYRASYDILSEGPVL